jgi:hypothetical protein
VVKGADDVWVKLARCCTPVPGDPIIGFVTRGQGVSVHRSDCVNVKSLTAQPDRLVDVEWAPTASSVFLVNIQVEALDRARLLSDVTRALSDQHVNILSASVTTTRDRVALSRFTFEMADPKHLGQVLRTVRSVDGCTTSTGSEARAVVRPAPRPVITSSKLVCGEPFLLRHNGFRRTRGFECVGPGCRIRTCVRPRSPPGTALPSAWARHWPAWPPTTRSPC